MKINIYRLKNIYRLIFISLFLFSEITTNGQITDINYINDSTQLTAELPQCNVFETLPNIAGVINQSWSGGVGYTKKKGIFLHTSPGAGTAYVLYYGFAANRFYTITITTSGGDSYTNMGTSTTTDASSLTNLFPSSGASTCTNDTHVPNYSVYANGGTYPIGSASHTYTFGPFNPPSAGYQYYVIWGYNSQLSTGGFYISDITINSVASSFSVTPASIPTITCGSAISQTFTANNVNNIPGVYSYTWSLGAVANNWYYNGSPAPATITTTGNTLSLAAPGCGPTPTLPVYFTANILNNYPVASANQVAETMYPILLNGPSSMCGQPTLYSVGPLNCATSSVTWSANPAADVSLSCTACNQTTVTKLVNGSNIVLTANLTGACATSPYNLTKGISVDPPNNLTGTYSTSTNTYPIQTVNFIQSGIINGQYTWPSVTNQSLTPSGSAIWYYGGSGSFEFYISSGQNEYLNFSGISSTCGTVTATRTFLDQSFGMLKISASPVPSTGNIDVNLTQVPDTTITLEKAQAMSSVTFKKATQISLYDINSGVLIKQWSYLENVISDYNLNLSGIKAGIYILKVERNNRIASTEILLQ